MTKKNSIKVPAIVMVRVIVFLSLGLCLLTLYVRSVEFLTTSALFEIKDVMIDRSIEFIDLHALKTLVGSNIFQVDIQRLDSQIARAYPYIAQLRLMRQLPDRILILAKKRQAFIQVLVKGKILVLDHEGVALYYVPRALDVTTVEGSSLAQSEVFLGRHLHDPAIEEAINILNDFTSVSSLKRWKVTSIQVNDLSRIDMTVSENLHIIFDQEGTKNKIMLLPILMAGHKIDLNKVKYIDLRFEEPVIAQNSI